METAATSSAESEASVAHSTPTMTLESEHEGHKIDDGTVIHGVRADIVGSCIYNNRVAESFDRATVYSKNLACCHGVSEKSVYEQLSASMKECAGWTSIARTYKRGAV